MLNKVLYLWIRLMDRLEFRGRREALLLRFASVGKNVTFDPFATFVTPETTILGNNVFIGNDSNFSGKVNIGNGCMFGPELALIAGNHYFGVNGLPVRQLRPRNNENDAPIQIEAEVWGGIRVTVLGGTTIGMGTVIGAGSVVTRSLPPYVVAIGNPCRPIKKILGDTDLVEHLRILGLDEISAQTILERRTIALRHADMEHIPVVDQTSLYQRIWQG